MAYVHFSQEVLDQANNVSIESILRDYGEELIKSGREKRWTRHDSVTVRGNRWYQHSQRKGGLAISFMMRFYDMNFVDAVNYLSTQTLGSGISVQGAGLNAGSVASRETEEKRKFALPEKNENTNRAYAYLVKTRMLDREIVGAFMKAGKIYESRSHHNVVFVGHDEDGQASHAHMVGTYTKGNGFRGNLSNSLLQYSFHHIGTGNRLYVFEAPIDMLSYISIHQRDWQSSSYVSLCGVSEQPVMEILKHNPQITKIRLALDHDAKGIEACYRIRECLVRKGYENIGLCLSKHKDWNEDLKAMNGLPVKPAEPHPKLIALCKACDALMQSHEEIQCAESVYCLDGLGKVISEMVAEVRGFGKEMTVDDASRIAAQMSEILPVLYKDMAEQYESMDKTFDVNVFCQEFKKDYEVHRDLDIMKSKVERLHFMNIEMQGKLKKAKGTEQWFDSLISTQKKFILQCLTIKINLELTYDLEDLENCRQEPGMVLMQ